VAAGIGSVPELPSAKPRPARLGVAYFDLVQPGLPLEIEKTAAAQANGDPRVRAVDARWHACMAKSGYSYRTPIDAMGDPRWAPGTTEATARRGTQRLQMAVAVADAGCQQQVNFAGTRLAVLAGYQDQLISSNLDRLHQYESQMAKLVANARLILGGNQP
jgi:hypothetical protein